MATVTPNFNWPVPTSTDLVKDGATAIEALGDSIDASLVDLKGGTTGQVLSKTSNTDMDFTWVTNADGDITGVTAGTGLTGGGTSGIVTLAVDPTYAGFTNLNYISNPVLNSAFQIWQRGTSFAISGNAYTADRWMGYRGVAGATISRQVTNDTTNLPNIQYCARVQRDSGNTATDFIALVNTFESVNSIPFVGKTVTLSFYARAGANFSAASSALSVTLATGTGTDQNVLLSYTGTSNIISASATLTSTWQRFSYTATLATSATEMGLYFNYSPVGTAGANDYFETTGVQIDIGSVALPFRTYAATIQGELAACQRYYFRVVSGNLYTPITSGGFSQSSTVSLQFTPFPVEMRVAPTALEQSGTASQYGINESGGGFTCNSVVTFNTATKVGAASIFNFASGLTQGRGAWGRSDNNTTAFLAWSAEL
jgi:hypothetical protein